MNAQRFDVMIIGGGILGLATGYKYLLSHPGKSLALLESCLLYTSDAADE